MNKEQDNCLRFSLEEFVNFSRGAEVLELSSVSLEPNVTSHEFDQYVILKGTLELAGEYVPRALDAANQTDEFYSAPNLAHVTTTDRGTSQFSYPFPVDITVPADRVRNIEELHVGVRSLDCQITDSGAIQASAELYINGVYEREQLNEVHHTNKFGDLSVESNIDHQETHRETVTTPDVERSSSEFAPNNHQAVFQAIPKATDFNPISNDLSSTNNRPEEYNHETNRAYPETFESETPNLDSTTNFETEPPNLDNTTRFETETPNLDSMTNSEAETPNLDSTTNFEAETPEFARAIADERSAADWSPPVQMEDVEHIRQGRHHIPNDSMVSVDEFEASHINRITEMEATKALHLEEVPSQETYQMEIPPTSIPEVPQEAELPFSFGAQEPITQADEFYVEVERQPGMEDFYDEHVEQFEAEMPQFEPEMLQEEMSISSEEPQRSTHSPVSDIFSTRSAENAKLKVYIVQQGDSLDRLGEKYDIHPHKLARHNRLAPEDVISKGSLIYIPK